MKKQARSKFRKLSKEEKDVKREYVRNRFRNMSEEDKRKLKVDKRSCIVWYETLVKNECLTILKLKRVHFTNLSVRLI